MHLAQYKKLQRTNGDSAVGSFAYRAGIDATDYKTGVFYSFKDKSEVQLSGFYCEKFQDELSKINLEIFFNQVEQNEKRGDATLGFSWEEAIPNEYQGNPKAIERHIQKRLKSEEKARKGCVIHYGFHNKDGNLHVHFWCSERVLKNVQGENLEFGNKERAWAKVEVLHKMRERMATDTNELGKEFGFDFNLDHRSYEEQGLDIIPTIHEGKSCNENYESRKEHNEEIRKTNTKKIEEQKQILVLEEEIKKLGAKRDVEIIKEKIEKACETPKLVGMIGFAPTGTNPDGLSADWKEAKPNNTMVVLFKEENVLVAAIDPDEEGSTIAAIHNIEFDISGLKQKDAFTINEDGSITNHGENIPFYKRAWAGVTKYGSNIISTIKKTFEKEGLKDYIKSGFNTVVQEAKGFDMAHLTKRVRYAVSLKVDEEEQKIRKQLEAEAKKAVEENNKKISESYTTRTPSKDKNPTVSAQNNINNTYKPDDYGSGGGYGM